MFIATRALYELVGTHPPGGSNNVLVGVLAREFRVSGDSIRMRLFNYGNRDRKAKNMGLTGGGGTTQFMASLSPIVFTALLEDVKKRHPVLRNAI
jgi:hypothetical protein